MPHLSPMSWILAPLMFFGLLAVMAATLWWSQLPIFPKILSTSKFSPSNPWNWS
uniref:ATP synthase F0 subunit 8 n=1 Tax=Pectinaria gouldii TaxID=260746 RepID=G8XXK1_PECGU|nr:ATP synthase F0 subunit 8 [Pectinaria gouldii]